MPNFHVNFYLSDEDYVRYIHNKPKYRGIAVQAMKDAIEGDKK